MIKPITTHQRLAWCPEGHETWEWNGHNINYIEMGNPSKPALLLIHGFGVNSYHFRSNIPDLSKNYHVFAFDMLGHGCSSMPLQDYAPEIWRDQTVDFVREVIGRPTAIAGNSLGGLTALYAATSEALKPLITSCILINAALRFRTGSLIDLIHCNGSEKAAPPRWRLVQRALTSVKKSILGTSFKHIKKPKNIKNVLHLLYPVASENVDEELIESILCPATNENASEIFYRMLCKNGPMTNIFADDLLAQLSCPLLLCWGRKDPWFGPSVCDKVQSLYKQTTRVDINAGHCAHDEAPREVNAAIHSFLSQSLKR